MSEWQAHDPGSYSSPQPGAQPGAQYPPQAYGPPGQVPPGGPWPYPPAYSPYTQGYGYPGMGIPPGERRPGTLTASAVLGYVLAGFLIVSGFVVSFGASAVSTFENAFNNNTSSDIEFVLVGFVNLVAAGLVIAGGVMVINRNATGRILSCVGNGIVVVAAVYWIARWITRDGFHYLLIWALMFAGLAIVGLALAFTGAGNRWLAGTSTSYAPTGSPGEGR